MLGIWLELLVGKNLEGKVVEYFKVEFRNPVGVSKTTVPLSQDCR